MKNEYGITTKPMTARNPQANATIKCMHQAMGNVIRTHELEDTHMDPKDPWSAVC